MPRNLSGRHAAVTFGLFVSSSLFVGCDEATVERGEPVTGTVTLDGQPLDQGSVSFIPATGGDTSAVAPVAAGAYSLPPENGLKPGKYVVRISSVEGGAGDPNIMPGETKPAKERVPPAWNSKSKHEVEVVDGDNAFTFDLKSSG